MFRERMRLIPESVDGLTTLVQEKLAWLDGLMGNNDYICGGEMRMVDLILYCAMDFGTGVGQSISDDLKNLTAWFSRIDSRPSAKPANTKRLQKLECEVFSCLQKWKYCLETCRGQYSTASNLKLFYYSILEQIIHIRDFKSPIIRQDLVSSPTLTDYFESLILFD